MSLPKTVSLELRAASDGAAEKLKWWQLLQPSVQPWSEKCAQRVGERCLLSFKSLSEPHHQFWELPESSCFLLFLPCYLLSPCPFSNMQQNPGYSLQLRSNQEGYSSSQPGKRKEREEHEGRSATLSGKDIISVGDNYSFLPQTSYRTLSKSLYLYKPQFPFV